MSGGEDFTQRPRGSFVFLRDVCTLTGLPETYIRSLIQRDAFPIPIRLDGRRQSFVLGEVLDWLERVKAEKRSAGLSPSMAAAVRKGGLSRAASRRQADEVTR